MFTSFRNVNLIDKSTMRAIIYREWNICALSRTFFQFKKRIRRN